MPKIRSMPPEEQTKTGFLDALENSIDRAGFQVPSELEEHAKD